MAIKKFLSAEEVCDLYGVDETVLQDLVKDGSLKALADRGTWKFRRDDIDSLVKANMLHPTKELPVVGEEAAPDILAFADEGPSSSAVDFIELDEEALAEQPTMITSGKDAGLFPSLVEESDDSSSDVNVVLEPMGSDYSDSDIRLGRHMESAEKEKKSGDTSDSDVRTLSSLSAPISAVTGEGSDSDVKTVSDQDAVAAPVTGNTSDSDVKTLSSAEIAATSQGSDSDVTTVSSVELAATGPSGSDSDVSTLSSFEMAAADSGLLESTGDTHTQEIELEEEEEGISLPPRSAEPTLEMNATSDSTFDLASDSAFDIAGSSVKSGDSSMLIDPGSSVLDEEDSGITLDAGDSGISLETGDSGIMLDAGDSGIALDADSGITLSADSGISVQEPAAPKAGGKFDKTEEMFNIPESDFEIAESVSSRHATPSEEELEATAAFKLDQDDDSATMPTVLGVDEEEEKPRKRDPLGFSGAIAAGATIENLEVVEDLDQMVPDEADVTEAVFDEEDDVLEASDESFAEFDEAPAEDEMMSEEFEAPVVAAKAPKKEKGWGGLATASVLAASLLMGVNAWILWEGIATMWTGAQPSGPAASIISSLAGLF